MAEGPEGIDSCPQCGGRGQIAFQQGFFTLARTCGRCGGAGRVIVQPCATCEGQGRVREEKTLRVNIPAGVDDGNRLRLTGEGEDSRAGGPSGDLYVVIQVRPNDIFVREGDDLLCEVPIHFTVAALGGEIEVPTLNGAARLKVPAGTQNGTVFRLRGKGMPNVHGRGKGDQHIRVMVEIPSKLSRPLREKLQELAEIANDDAYPHRKSWLAKAKRFFGK